MSAYAAATAEPNDSRGLGPRAFESLPQHSVGPRLRRARGGSRTAARFAEDRVSKRQASDDASPYFRALTVLRRENKRLAFAGLLWS
jgi:hypothetical protein